MNITIRQMTTHDFPILAAWMVETPLWQRYGLTVERAIANFEKALTAGDWLFTADADTPACGFAWVVPNGAFGRSPYLRMFGVRESAQRSGVGTALLNVVESRAAEVSDDIYLLVTNFNEHAQSFYKRHGYEQIGAIPGYVVPSITELIFRKRLR